MNAIFKRCSVRSYSDKVVEIEKIENALHAGMQAPSAHNFQPWEFLVINEPEAIAAVSEMSPYAKFSKNAGALIMVMCDLKKVKKEDYWWQQDLAACTQNILLQLVEDGLGATWLGFYPEKDRVEKAQDYFQLPENLVPFSVVALGYPKDEDKEVKSRFDSNKIHINQYRK